MEDKEKLNEVLLENWIQLMEGTLDVVQLTAIPTQWPMARSKILRLMNNYVRTLRDELDVPLDNSK